MENFTEILQNRRSFYALLARIYRIEADQALITGMQAMTFPKETGSEKLDRGYRALEAWLAAPGEDPVEDLAVDYARVFIGAGIQGKEAAYPFESVYTSPQGLVMQDAWEKVCALYRAHGLGRPEHCDVHEDHIGLELDFMTRLIDEALAAGEKGDEGALLGSLAEQKVFIETHLLNWIHGFLSDVRKYAESPFYLAAADITEAFVEMDDALLREILEEEKAS
ncbi:molecular chaperone [Sutterella sp.]|uniref:TorD/DmsD family molecular chaperone n=1 Tax=Sutterella sp. TaxID=1981025 RepID=UPI0026DF99E0|nr:molecular chaperone TorD family protein [Sutterella sp.]MDO5530899.1 molecular chaperone TorD family protein [Sutterella sp.]